MRSRNFSLPLTSPIPTGNWDRGVERGEGRYCDMVDGGEGRGECQKKPMLSIG